MQVGAVTGIQARCVWRVSQCVSARVALRVGTSGVDLEVGGTQRISEFSAAGLAVAVGLYVSASGCSLLTPRTGHIPSLWSQYFLAQFEAGSYLFRQEWSEHDFGCSLLTPRIYRRFEISFVPPHFEAGSYLLCQKVQRAWYHILQVCVNCCMYKSCPWP